MKKKLVKKCRNKLNEHSINDTNVSNVFKVASFISSSIYIETADLVDILDLVESINDIYSHQRIMCIPSEDKTTLMRLKDVSIT